MASDRIAERRRVFKQYKEDVKERGKPFYPYAMFHDTVMSLVVVVVIIGLAIVWKYTTPGHHTGTGAGWLGKLLDAPADPGTINFVPRPDWYFYFLFYLLRIFKWPDTVLLGTIGIPTICLVLLLAMPFIDVRAERRLLRRPVAIDRVDPRRPLDGRPHLQGRDREGGARLRAPRPRAGVGAEARASRTNKQAIAGAKLFAVSGCLNCHTYLSDGGHNLGAPDLTAEGAKNKGIAFQIAHLKCPSCVNPGSPMPSFAGPRRRAPGAARRVPRGLQGPRQASDGPAALARAYAADVRVFLGITGASGAPYARRLLQSLAAADCEVGVSVSGAAIEVLATELYGDARLSRDETLARFTEAHRRDVTVYEPNDWRRRTPRARRRSTPTSSARARWARSARSPRARCRT